jgi:hypothetical protein
VSGFGRLDWVGTGGLLTGFVFFLLFFHQSFGFMLSFGEESFCQLRNITCDQGARGKIKTTSKDRRAKLCKQIFVSKCDKQRLPCRYHALHIGPGVWQCAFELLYLELTPT